MSQHRDWKPSPACICCLRCDPFPCQWTFLTVWRKREKKKRRGFLPGFSSHPLTRQRVYSANANFQERRVVFFLFFFVFFGETYDPEPIGVAVSRCLLVLRCLVRSRLCLWHGSPRGKGRTGRPRTGSSMDTASPPAPAWGPRCAWFVTGRRPGRTFSTAQVGSQSRFEAASTNLRDRNPQESFLPPGCTAFVHKGCKESVPPCLKVSHV